MGTSLLHMYMYIYMYMYVHVQSVHVYIYSHTNAHVLSTNPEAAHISLVYALSVLCCFALLFV